MLAPENYELETLLNREIDAPAIMTHQEVVSRIKNTWYADEVKRRIEEYKSGKIETIPWNEGWEEIEEFLNGL